MKFTTTGTVRGIKRSKGVLENGQAYDSTKIYVDTDLDDSRGNGKGQATAEYTFGTSEEYAKLEHNSFPLECELTLEIVTTGRVQRTTVVALKPVSFKKAA